MLSRRKILSAMAGFAMLALPVSALAGHHNDRFDQGPRGGGFQHAAHEGGFQRPFAPHDQGFHNGWAKHQSAPFVNNGRYWATPRVARTWPVEQNWYDHHEDWDENHPGRNYWAQPNRWNDGDADDWGRRNYRCDADGDDCHWSNGSAPRYWQNYGGYDYGAPYSWYDQQPPASYAPQQQLSWLMARRQRAMAIIARMRARGDNRGAARMVAAVNRLDRRIAAMRGYGGYNGYVPPAAYVPPANDYGYGSPLSPILGGAAAPYYGNTNPYYANNGNYGGAGPYYGVNGYNGNSTTGAIVSMLPYFFGAH